MFKWAFRFFKKKIKKKQKSLPLLFPSEKMIYINDLNTVVFNQIIHQKNPTLCIIENFISSLEANEWIRMAQRNMEKSTIVSSKNRRGGVKTVSSDFRNSFSATLDRNHPLSKNIMQRLCNLLQCDVKNIETLQLVKYSRNDYFRLHTDTVKNLNMFQPKNGGQRAASIVIYLNTVLSDENRSGYTHFPFLHENGVRIQPVQGRVVVWNNICEDTRKILKNTMHESITMKQGTKFIVSTFIREGKFK